MFEPSGDYMRWWSSWGVFTRIGYICHHHNYTLIFGSSTQSILKAISPGISLERMMLKLKLHYFGHLKEFTHWKRLWCWEGLGAGEEGDDRGWDGWMASLTRWTWVWVNSGSWWWTGRPGVLRFIGSQRVGHDWATELNWTEYSLNFWLCLYLNLLCIFGGTRMWMTS